MSTAKTYYIEVKSSKYIADDLADYLENGPLYRDDDGTAEDATYQVVNLRAAAREALAVAEAATALRHKMREVYADSRYMNVWATAQERLGPYSGPDWIAESAALDAALALGPDAEGKEEGNG